MLKLRMILWALGYMMKRAARKSDDVQKKIEGKQLSFLIQTDDQRLARHYIIADGKADSHSGVIDSPAFTLSFKDAQTGVRILTDRDKNAFMKAIQDKDLTVTGDFAELMWFQGFVPKVMKS